MQTYRSGVHDRAANNVAHVVVLCPSIKSLSLDGGRMAPHAPQVMRYTDNVKKVCTRFQTWGKDCAVRMGTRYPDFFFIQHKNSRRGFVVHFPALENLKVINLIGWAALSSS